MKYKFIVMDNAVYEILEIVSEWHMVARHRASRCRVHGVIDPAANLCAAANGVQWHVYPEDMGSPELVYLPLDGDSCYTSLGVATRDGLLTGLTFISLGGKKF
ncbi:MAG: hypothetical protein DRI57_09830 [Deltaproteobacteria bacterium]|nr:MAG: hypothetical protein DRI57_09830 [Deltaproteobacteria bacterium]